VLDGGDLDCGSGLALLLRETMLGVPEGSVLEIRSRDATVSTDLPPWCRLSGHEYLGKLEGEGYDRHLVRRGSGGAAAEQEALEADERRARQYEWHTRVRHTGHLRSRVYCRTFRFDVGQAASFAESDAHPSAVEYLLGALGGALANGFATECARDGIELDDLELTVRGKLHDVLAHLGLGEDGGDPSFSSIRVKCFASTFHDPTATRTAWTRAVARSPLAATLAKAVDLELALAIV